MHGLGIHKRGANFWNEREAGLKVFAGKSF